jgi:hypothetical protein
LEASFGTQLTQDEQQQLAEVEMRWEVVSQAVCYYAAMLHRSRKPEADIALDALLVISRARLAIQIDFIGTLGVRLPEAARRLGGRLGLPGDDGHIAEVERVGLCLRVKASDAFDGLHALTRMHGLNAAGFEPSTKLVAAVVSEFGVGNALEGRLQAHRNALQPAERSHLDRVALLEALRDIEQMPWADPGFGFGRMVRPVRHRLRETYIGEARGPSAEELRPSEVLDTMPASPSFEPDATPEMLERVGRYLPKLPPAEREAVEEFSRSHFESAPSATMAQASTTKAR